MHACTVDSSSTAIDIHTTRDKQLHDEGTYNRQDAVFRGRLNVKRVAVNLCYSLQSTCLYDLYDAIQWNSPTEADESSRGTSGGKTRDKAVLTAQE